MSPPERPSPIPPAFAQARRNQNEREMPPAYILATSPVAIQGEWRKERQLPLSLILLITSYVSLGLLFHGYDGWRLEIEGRRRLGSEEGRGVKI